MENLDLDVNPLYCSLCELHLNSSTQSEQHYQGTKHKKKLQKGGGKSIALHQCGGTVQMPCRLPTSEDDFQKILSSERFIIVWKNQSLAEILRFHGHQRLNANTVLPMTLLYFMDDHTMTVLEGDGSTRVRIIKRARHSKNSKQPNSQYHWTDLNTGIEVCLQGLDFRIDGCDKATFNFLVSQGVRVQSQPVLSLDTQPSTPKFWRQGQRNTSTAQKRQFIEKDQQVLRFYCTAKSHQLSTDEVVRYCELLYYLADDTIAIRPSNYTALEDGNSSVMLSRQKVPKSLKVSNGFFLSTALEISTEEVEEWYTPLDFDIGRTVEVYGRKLQLSDCDQFTRHYYKIHYGRELAKPTESESHEHLPNTALLSQFPSNPTKLEDSKSHIDSKSQNSYHFSANMISPFPEDKDREFIVTYFTEDASISIRERHSGGRFLSRIHVPAPFTDLGYYVLQDFFPDASLQIFGYRFQINQFLGETIH